MEVTLYTTHCPRCTVLEKKMQQANIKYNIVEDIDIMTQKGFMSLPMLEVDDNILDFSEAIRWVNFVDENAFNEKEFEKNKVEIDDDDEILKPVENFECSTCNLEN